MVQYIEDDDLIATAAENSPFVEHSYDVDINLEQDNNDDVTDEDNNDSDVLSDDLLDYVSQLNFIE